MSGPITAGYFLAHGLLLLSARALDEARAAKQEFGAVRDRLQRREDELAQARRQQRDARIERMGAIRRRADQLASRLETLRSLASTVASRTEAATADITAADVVRPMTQDDAAWVAYVAALEVSVADTESWLGRLGGELGTRVRPSATASVRVQTIDDVLSAHVLQRQLKPGLDADQTERFRATASRILARLGLGDDDALPPALQTLAREVVLASSLDRAEALASELRRAVQFERDAYVMRRQEAEEARALLERLPQDTPPLLLQALERVAAGVDRFNAALRDTLDMQVSLGVEAQEQLAQEAAALVLEQSLRDLGYEVEGIEATLFAEGGAAHFRRQGWDNYFVRMRVDAAERTVNFNVVRARGDEETAERRRLDALAEDRWCAEFPRLLQTLAARGLRLDVTRRLGAGELPVQVVDGASLPRTHDEQSASRPHDVHRGRQRP